MLASKVCPLAHTLGFEPLPGAFFAALAGMVLGYLALIEAGKRIFYRAAAAAPGGAPRTATPRRFSRRHHLRRRAAYFSSAARGG